MALRLGNYDYLSKRMSARTIQNRFEDDYRLIGIATTLKEYRLAYLLNELLGCDFRKIKDIIFESAARERNVFFSVMKAEGNYGKTIYVFFANKNGTDVLLPEAGTFDYLLKLQGECSDEHIHAVCTQVQQWEEVVMCCEIPLERVKNKERLIYEEELKSVRPIFKRNFR
ncbi:MAG: IPExxxVDY family protein [Chitinophagales bacterium]|nr:IPExxxVDY family protein [Chitinophagales bacterium]